MNARTDEIKQYNPVYDLIRGAAAMTVFVGHAYPVWSNLSGLQLKTEIVNALLFLSVEFFFALSGILLGPILYRQFQKARPFHHVKIFLMRRWYRTLPTYYFGLAFWVFLYYFAFSYDEMEIAQYLPEYFFFVQNLFGQHDEFFLVAWSISIEEIFYVVFTGIVAAGFLIKANVDRSFKLTIFMIFLFSFIMRAIELQGFADWNADIRQASLLRLDSIAIGAMVGLYFTNLTQRAFWSALFFIMATILYVSLGWHVIEASAVHIVLLQILFTFLPFACAIFVKYLADNWDLKPHRIIRFFADISYPLYIFHLALVPFFFNVGLEASYLLLGTYMACTVGFCYMFFRYVETPILKRRPKYER